MQKENRPEHSQPFFTQEYKGIPQNPHIGKNRHHLAYDYRIGGGYKKLTEIHRHFYQKIIKRRVHIPGCQGYHTPHRLADKALRKKLIIPDITAQTQIQAV